MMTSMAPPSASCRTTTSRTNRQSERQSHADKATVLRIGCDLETDAPAHFQHHRILLENLSTDRPQPLGASVFDNQLHERPAETVSLHIGAHEDGVFGGVVVRVRVHAHHA